MLDDISVWLVTPILEPALCKLCTNINQLYLIWAAVLCHRPPPKDQRMLGEDTGFKRYCAPQSKKKTKAWLHSPVDDLGADFEDEIQPANYISNKINI